MSLRTRLDTDLKEAMKARDQLRVDTIRGIKAAVKTQEVSGKQASTLEEPEILRIVAKLAKQREDSIEQFGRAGRQDLVEKEQKELAILQTYLPRQLEEAELEALVAETIAETGASGPKDMSAVMKALRPKVIGTDGRLVSEIVKKKLAGG